MGKLTRPPMEVLAVNSRRSPWYPVVSKPVTNVLRKGLPPPPAAICLHSVFAALRYQSRNTPRTRATVGRVPVHLCGARVGVVVLEGNCRKAPPQRSGHSSKPLLVTNRRQRSRRVVASAKVVAAADRSASDEVQPPASEGECVQQAVTAILSALSKTVGSGGVGGMGIIGGAKGVRKQKQGVHLRQPRLRIQIPVADESPSTGARLAMDLVSALRERGGGRYTSPIELCFADPDARAATGVDHEQAAQLSLRISDSTNRSMASSESSLIFVVSPREEQVPGLQLFCNSAGCPVIVLNPYWSEEASLSPGVRGFIGSFDIVYSFTPLAIQGLFSKSEGAVLKYVRSGHAGASPWMIFAKEDGEFKMKTELRKAPSPEELEKVDKVRWMPSPSGNPAERFLALGSWDFDQRVSRLEILAIDTSQEVVAFSDEAQQTAPRLQAPLRYWELNGRVTDLQVVPREGNDVMLVTGSTDGHISLVMTDLSQSASSSSQAASVMQLPAMHKGSVTGLDVGRDSLDVAMVGEDGKINIIGLVHGIQQPLTTWDMRGTVSFSAVQWTSVQELVTAGTGGVLQCWDRRQGGRSVSQAPLRWAHQEGLGAMMHCIDVHPSRRHICAVGCSGGSVVAWDLRWQQEPLVLVGPLQQSSQRRRSSSGSSIKRHSAGQQTELLIAEGDVWEVRFDSLAQGGVRAGVFDTDRNKLPPVMMCSEDGVLALAGGGEALELYVGSCAINTFDVDPEFGQDVICGTEHECLVYLRRARYGVGVY
ncbi:hypothetical protein CBR_g22430 [Chara braunii]|uniref:DUF1995 domain-containing protein n=1 Tax=Chara braunii TaxID=69332 RepID=A0A388JV89_CHABU|nr:hypothetical protein CBR_g22430 [Chara braunii]|eukprot:GBG61632.1 hypothetical protein CBR_g22430 [Chara braunii]